MGSVLGVATVEWTCVAIYHLSLSTCVGGPAAGIIAIWEQLTVIPSFCLCESSSSPCTPTGTSSLEMTSSAGTKKLWVCRSSCCISLSARLQFFLGGLERPLSKPLHSLSGTPSTNESLLIQWWWFNAGLSDLFYDSGITGPMLWSTQKTGGNHHTYDLDMALPSQAS